MLKNASIYVENLWIAYGEAVTSWVQLADKFGVMPTAKRLASTCAQVIQVMCTGLMSRLDRPFNSFEYPVVPIIHTPYNYYYLI